MVRGLTAAHLSDPSALSLPPHNHSQEDRSDNDHKVDKVHLNDGYSDNQCDGAAKDPSLLISHNTILGREGAVYGELPLVAITSPILPLAWHKMFNPGSHSTITA